MCPASCYHCQSILLVVGLSTCPASALPSHRRSDTDMAGSQRLSHIRSATDSEVRKSVNRMCRDVRFLFRHTSEKFN